MICKNIKYIVELEFQFWFLTNLSSTKASSTKAELPQVGIFCCTQFPSWEFLLIKKLEIKKTKPTDILSVLKFVY